MPFPYSNTTTDRDRDLKRRQQEHLQKVKKNKPQKADCSHNQCSQCIGTGVKVDGTPCIHMIACSCPICSPSCISYPPANEGPWFVPIKEYPLATPYRGTLNELISDSNNNHHIL